MSKIKTQEYLYELVNNLTSSEKRYFKIFSRNHTIGKENNYLLLFDMIVSKQRISSVINEKELKENFQTKYKKARFDLYKSNLYKKILQSLEAFHKSNFIELEIRSKISQANILHNKGLPNQALSQIKSIKSLCLEYEKWYMLLEILELERHITYAIQMPPIENQEELNILKKVVSAGHFRNVQSEIWKTYITVGLPTDTHTMATYTELKKNPIFQKDVKSLTLETNMVRLYCLQFLSGMETKIPETYRFGNELIQLMEAHPVYMSNKSELYIRTLINLQYAQIRLNKYDEVINSIENCKQKIVQLNVVPALRNSIMISLFINQYDINFKNSNQVCYKSIVQEMQAFYNMHHSEMGAPTKLLYFWQNALHCLNSEEFADAIDWIDSINQINSPYRLDIQAIARIMNLIIHFELKNYEYLKYYTLNTFRYLKRKERLLPVENVLINFIRKDLAKNKSKKAISDAFKKLKSDIQIIKKGEDSHEALLLMYFENWIDKKITKTKKTHQYHMIDKALV